MHVFFSQLERLFNIPKWRQKSIGGDRKESRNRIWGSTKLAITLSYLYSSLLQALYICIQLVVCVWSNLLKRGDHTTIWGQHIFICFGVKKSIILYRLTVFPIQFWFVCTVKFLNLNFMVLCCFVIYVNLNTIKSQIDCLYFQFIVINN